MSSCLGYEKHHKHLKYREKFFRKKVLNMKLEDLMVIDWHAIGNVVRFYLGEKGQNDYCGDDWDDAPYEHNAGKVYSEFISGYIDMAWDINTIVKEPCTGYCNSPYCKDDFKKRKVPVIVIHKVNAMADEKVYLGDPAEELIKMGEAITIEINDN